MIRLLAVAVIFWGIALPAWANCRQALALGLDVSGSVDAREYRQQIDGVVTALDDARVRQALLAIPQAPVNLMVYEWSGPGDHRILVPWRSVLANSDIDVIRETLLQARRRDAAPGTALGTAMLLGLRLLDARAQCWKRTLDISGDGKSNLGPRPRDVRDEITKSGITINGLVIGTDAPEIGDQSQTQIGELSAYYNAEVILGPDAFVLTALGFSDYARAMTQKLLRELDIVQLSRR